MTRDELNAEIWKELPWVRKRLLGKGRVFRLIEACATQAPVELLKHVAGRAAEIEIVRAAWRANAKKRYSTQYGQDVIEFGPLFWIVASAVIQFIIQKLLEWWFSRSDCRAVIELWRRER